MSMLISSCSSCSTGFVGADEWAGEEQSYCSAVVAGCGRYTCSCYRSQSKRYYLCSWSAAVRMVTDAEDADGVLHRGELLDYSSYSLSSVFVGRVSIYGPGCQS